MEVEVPSLSDLCEVEVKYIYGLTPDEVQELIEGPDSEDPDRQDPDPEEPWIPSHHRVDPRVIKAYLTDGSVPTYIYHPTEVEEFRGQEEQEIHLVNDRYSLYHASLRHWIELHSEDIKDVEDYFKDPSRPFPEGAYSSVPTVEAAELQWIDGYLHTYSCIDDCVLLDPIDGPFRNRYDHDYAIAWHAGKSAKEIYATALTIFQLGRPILYTFYRSPLPNFNDLGQQEKSQVFEDLLDQLDSFDYRYRTQDVLFSGDTRSTEPGALSDRSFVTAHICKYQIVFSHAYVNFPSIDELRRILLVKYSDEYIEFYDEEPQIREVKPDTSWEGGKPVRLPLIPPDSEILDNYREYRDRERLNTASVRERRRIWSTRRVAKRSRPTYSSSSEDSLFRDFSDISSDSDSE